MRIHQVVNTLVKGDAIGNNVFAMNKVLRTYYSDTKIFACNIGGNINDSTVNKISKLPELDADDIVIYHLCEACMINDLIPKLKCKKIAIYHNTTPAYFFKQFDTAFSLMQKKARKQIAKLSNTFDLCIAVSNFNKDDLMELGFDGSKIITMPIIIPTQEYITDLDKITKYYDDKYINILFVGRIVPNKKQEDIIRVFTYYQKYINKCSRLILVGSPFTQDYLDLLKKYIKDLNVDNIEFKQSISFNDIKRIYKSANIFLCMSEHEGFCVPLVEAMLFNVPILAYDIEGVSETLGEGGALIDTKEPCVIANIINEIVCNKKFRNDILEYQQERVKYFDYDLAIRRFDKIIREFLKHNS